MSKNKAAILTTAFLLLLGLTGASAQSFFPNKMPGLAQVRFTSPAAGVQVSIDGQFAGTIPFSVWVTLGVHQFTFQAPGQEAQTIPYPVRGNTDVPYVVTQRTFPLTVNTNVPNASLAIDGAPFAGNSTSVTAGAHTLTVTAPGYQLATVPFNQPSQPNTLNVTLIANTFPLTVNTNVPNASLAIDGVPFAGRSIGVTPGAHTLTVNAPGYQPATVPFTQPSQPNTLNLTLIANTFPLTVNTNVPNASLAIDGVPFAGNSTAVTAGAHTLTVTAPSYQPATVPFTQPSQPNTLNVTLLALSATVTVDTNRLFKVGTRYKLLVNNVENRGSTLTLNPGTYQVRIISDAVTVETSIVVTSGQNLTLTPSVVWDVR